MRTPVICALLSFLLLTSCVSSLPTKDVITVSPAENLAGAQIVDVAVLPPLDATQGRETMIPGIEPQPLPLEAFRVSAYKELIQRRYTPLSLEYLDRALLGKASPTEASLVEMRGRWGEDAMLLITVNRWDLHRLKSRNLFSVAADFFLIEAKSGETIWTAKADQDLNLSSVRGIDRLDREEKIQIGVDRFVKKVLNRLPRREIPAN